MTEELININGCSLPKKDWIDEEYYYLNIHAQGTEHWKHMRQKLYLLTASRFGEIYAPFNKVDNQPEEIAREIVGLKVKYVDPYYKELMENGTKTEPIARKYYEDLKGVKVREVGLAVPKWDTRIGYSADGFVDDGLIEIKSPKKMYKKLKLYLQAKENKYELSPDYHDHISIYHYCQMQVGMIICAKPWCDYIVYCSEESLVFLERVYFNQNFWYNELYPKINYFLTNYLQPLIYIMRYNKEENNNRVEECKSITS